MAIPRGDIFDALGSRDPFDHDVLAQFTQGDPPIGKWKLKDGQMPDFLKAIEKMDELPTSLRDRLWSLEKDRQSSQDAKSHDLIEFEEFKLLDYWTEYGISLSTPPSRCDKEYVGEVQDSLLRLCLQLNRYGFRGADGALFMSHCAQIDLLMAAIKRFRDDSSLFPDQDCKEKFWRVVLKCQNYLKETKSTSYLERVHRSRSTSTSSVTGQEEKDGHVKASSKIDTSSHVAEAQVSLEQFLWLQFLHRDAPITDKKPFAGMYHYTQIVPPGGQKILECWDWEHQSEMVAITVNHQWKWKYGYTGLARKKIEKTLFGETRVVELVSDTENSRLQKLKDIEGRLIGDWGMRHALETFTFCTRNWLEENNPSDAVLNDFLHVHKASKD